MLTTVIVILAVPAVCVALLMLLKHWARRMWDEALKSFVKSQGLLATTPEAILEHNVAMALKLGDTLTAVALLANYVVECLEQGKAIKTAHVDFLRMHGGLERVDEHDQRYCECAAYRMANVQNCVVYFDETLQRVFFHNFQEEFKEALCKVLELKCLDWESAWLLRRFHWLSDVEPCEGRYGHRKFPYPAVRFSAQLKVDGKRHMLYFDENNNLIVEIGEGGDVLWELPGARRPEFYD